MSQVKAKFIESLQTNDNPLSPYDISQAIRKEFYWVCLYKGDPFLDPDVRRGYMVRTPITQAASADEPAMYTCAIAEKQSMGWQNITWIKEMLHALDGGDSVVNNSEKLGNILDINSVHQQNNIQTPVAVVHDCNGFDLALGCAVPRTLRQRLRMQKSVNNGNVDPVMRSDLCNIPDEYIDYVLNEEFEKTFEQALSEIRQQ
jgi:hypothetical protein